MYVYLDHVNWVQWQINGNNGEVWAEVHHVHVTMPLSPVSFVSKAYKYNQNVVPPPQFLVGSYTYDWIETIPSLTPDGLNLNL